MSEVTVNSTICGFVHNIKGEIKGDKILVEIDSDCKKIKQMSPMEVPMMDTFDIKENYVINKAQEAKCSATCLVPRGILHVCRLEAGFLAQSLVDKSGSISIDFK
ncbi:hypothetical protein [Methanohalobium sp.]|uniref:DUF6951 family protein n=1 Tax=Methanohalobium sp. TaxID=2837493 RepID=UPI0025E24604|nr:hypothetical protein [Methanohalobium sp.]